MRFLARLARLANPRTSPRVSRKRAESIDRRASKNVRKYTQKGDMPASCAEAAQAPIMVVNGAGGDEWYRLHTGIRPRRELLPMAGAPLQIRIPPCPPATSAPFGTRLRESLPRYSQRHK